MPAEASPHHDMRVLLLAPTARDAEASRALLIAAKIECVVCADLPTLCQHLVAGAAAVIVPEEEVLADASNQLRCLVGQQPVWSDLPVLVLSRSGVESPAVEQAVATLGNVTLIERPVRVSTLLSVVRSALRARERQYQVRDHLAQRAAIEESLRQSQERAEAASQAKDQFIAVLSHELRTPLSPVVMSVASMQQDPRLPPHLRDDVAMIRRNIELESKLIDDLLDVSRVTTGKLRLRMEPVAIHDVLDHVLAICASDIAQKRLDVRKSLHAQHDRVTGDSARLEQVFWNLLKNAIKFTPQCGRIALSTRDLEDGQIEVIVRDSGVGIQPDVLPRLFNAFEQGNPSVTRQFGGMGLGLAISKAIVDLHGGSIHAYSGAKGTDKAEPPFEEEARGSVGADTGAVFVVRLHTAAVASEPLPSPAPAASAQLPRLLRLLLVEDHPDTARMLSRLLGGLGYTVRTASSVASALALADSERFDLVISDIGLPDATGYDLMRQLRDRHGISGIALSGYGMEDDLRRSRESGFIDHVVKPVNVEQLQAIIRRAAE